MTIDARTIFPTAFAALLCKWTGGHARFLPFVAVRPKHRRLLPPSQRPSSVSPKISIHVRSSQMVAGSRPLLAVNAMPGFRQRKCPRSAWMEVGMTDKQLRLDIIEELDFEPSIDAADIGVAVDQGVVTITGHVRSLSEKITALDIVENVLGVRAIADEIEVRPLGMHVTADDEVAKRVINTLQWNTSVPDDKIHVTIKNGRVTLEGEVEWRYQSDAAERAIGRLTGVTGIDNRLKVKPSVKAEDVTERIRKALLRDAELDASGIRVEVQEGTVTLEGKVRYLGERKSAERAAWAAPGVTNVIDHLAVQ
jgi:osmotically-inducible protein OsmY